MRSRPALHACTQTVLGLISSSSVLLQLESPPFALGELTLFAFLQILSVQQFSSDSHLRPQHVRITLGQGKLMLQVRALPSSVHQHLRVFAFNNATCLALQQKLRFCLLQPGHLVLQGRMKVLCCTVLLLTLGLALAQPVERGTVPNDQYTAAPAPPPLGSEGWLTGRSTFFDGSDSFKNAYLARYSNTVAAQTLLLQQFHLLHCKVERLSLPSACRL